MKADGRQPKSNAVSSKVQIANHAVFNRFTHTLIVLFVFSKNFSLQICCVYLLIYAPCKAVYYISRDFYLWQYGLWSFQTGDTKLETCLPKNQHTQHSMARANLNKSVGLVTNTTTASKYIPKRTRISSIEIPPFRPKFT